MTFPIFRTPNASSRRARPHALGQAIQVGKSVIDVHLPGLVQSQRFVERAERADAERADSHFKQDFQHRR
jgi:hypothetical protein